MNGVTVELGGKSRTVKFTHNALARLEGQGLGWKLLGKAWDEKPISTLRAMIWATQEGPTLEDVGTWMDAGDLIAIGKAVWGAYVDALPEPQGGAMAEATTGPALSALPTAPSV